MKALKFFSIAAIAAATVMTSCSNDDEAVNPNKPVAVRFAANTAEVVQTRVSDNNWEGIETIGVYMVKHGTTNFTETEGAENISYTTVSTGTTADFTTATPIYFPVDGSKVDFIAYHPYQGSLANWTYKVDVKTANQAVQSNIDLMWSGVVNNTSGYDKTFTGNVVLPFEHQLVKLALTVQKGTGIANLTGLQVKIKGMKTTADFNVKTGALDNEDNPQDITPKGSEASWEAILLPVAALGAGHKIEFTLGDNTYTWVLTSSSISQLQAKNKYSYIVTLNKNKVQVTGSITNWNTVDGTGVAE